MRVTAHAGNVYWTNSIDRTVSGCSALRCDAATVLATGQPSPFDIVADDQSVYWTNNGGQGSVMRCAIAGCGNAPTTLFSSSPAPQAVFVDPINMSLYLAGGNLWRCTLPACKDQQFIGAVDGEGGGLTYFTLDVTRTNVYWVGYSRDTVVGTPLAAFCGRANGANFGPCGRNSRDVLASGQTPRGIVADATNLYWTNNEQGTIARCAVSGCSGMPSALATDQDGPTEIAIDAASVYWINWQGGTVMKCALPDCAGGPTIIVASQKNPSGIAVDELNVYWTSDAGLMKAPR